MLTYKITQVDAGCEGYYEASYRGSTITAETLEDVYYEILTMNFGVQFSYEFREKEGV